MQFNRAHTSVEPIRVPVMTYHQVYLGTGFKLLLGELLFPRDGSERRLITAIKALRAELGIGLKEAKDLVDALTPELLASTSDPTCPK